MAPILFRFIIIIITISTLSYHQVSAHVGCSSDRIVHSKPIHTNHHIKPKPLSSTKSNSNHHKNILDGRAVDPDPSNTDYENIRITYDTSQLEIDWADYPENRTYFVNDVIPAAFDWLQKVISVRPVDGLLSFDPTCTDTGNRFTTGSNSGKCRDFDEMTCGDTGAVIGEELFNSAEICTTNNANSCSMSEQGGIASDLIIFFTSDPGKEYTNDCASVMGFAAYCEDNSRHRPVAGYINLCRTTINATQVLTWEEAISLIIHEAFHVLGFSSDGFDNFVNENDENRQTVNQDVYQEITLRGSSRFVITLPTVAAYAKEFFGCDTMPGIELEDYNDKGQPTSHWDNRILIYDFMISYIPPAAPYSIFTLAVLHDSGWYQIDFTYAQEPSYGRGQGCSWFKQKCINNNDIVLDDTAFCSESVQYSCSSSYVGKYYCGLAEWNSDLPASQQYFDDSKIGGDNAYPDFCPIFEEYSNGDCRLFGDNNQGTSDDNTNELGGLITGTSKCAIIEGDTNGIGAGCYPQQCFKNSMGEYVGVRITLYRNYYLETFDVLTCWSHESGEKKEFPFDFSKSKNFGFDHIYCPNFDDICYDQNPWICNGHGTIVNGSCVCSPGYMGIDCTIEANQVNRNKYDDTDSISVYQETVCNSGIFAYSESDQNLGILSITINNIDNDTYIEAYFKQAIKNWISLLVEIDPCEVAIKSFVYDDDSGEASILIWYYSSYKTWSEVTEVEEASAFLKLFDDQNGEVVLEDKASEGYHPNNIDSANPHSILLSSAIALICSLLMCI